MAMARRRTKTLTVDGEPYRWRASRRAIMVEHVESQGGRVREFLTLLEPVGVERIPHLIQHAKGRGWQPTVGDDVFEINPTSVWDDPRARDYYQWMRLLRGQLHILEQYLECPVEVGAYWWHGNTSTEMGGFGARLRFGACHLMPEAEHWEAAYCITGTAGMKAYSDLFAFPFRDGANLGMAAQQKWRLWLKPDCEHTEGIWRSVGWQDWESQDEWGEASTPGSVFHRLKPVEPELSAAAGQPIPLRLVISRPKLPFDRTTHALHFLGEAERGTLVQHGAGDRWFPWGECEVAVIDQTESTMVVEADLAQHDIEGGWEPGRYQVSMRLRSTHENGECHSEITEPISVVIE